MKKREKIPARRPRAGILKGLCIAAVTLLCGACMTAPTVWDDAIPEEQLATVLFYAGIEIKSYNSIPVKDWRWVKIPAGEAIFELDIWNSTGYNRFSMNDLTLRYAFEAGKEYCMYWTKDEDNKYYGVNVYLGKPPAIGYPPQDALLGFARFSDVRGNEIGGTTVLK
ncbi:MAG: hypothetical protein LBL19_08240 [Spirochaetaceae bacterium]|jgi:hypothetical protein|nr:hypothetical protein [Spirochaetaceae bacterium]